MAILEVQDIHTYYGDAYVLQGLSLKLEEGQILGLLGRNGVGKTTLVNSIVGFNRPRRGKVLFKRGPADMTLAENALLTAVAIAQQQKARSFELRAAVDLARLYKATGAVRRPLMPCSRLRSRASHQQRNFPRSRKR